MSQWITEHAQEIREREKKEDDERAWALQCGQRIAKGWATVWGHIVGAVRADVTAYNAAADPNRQIHLQADTAGFKARLDERSATRVIQVHAFTEGVRIHKIVTTRNYSQQISDERFSFAMMPDSAVYLSVSTGHRVPSPQDASQAILRHLFN